jgi:hypothetical protein
MRFMFLFVVVLSSFVSCTKIRAQDVVHMDACPNTQALGKEMSTVFKNVQNTCIYGRPYECDVARARALEVFFVLQSQCYQNTFMITVVPVETKNDRSLVFKYNGPIKFDTCKHITNDSSYLCQYYAKDQQWRCIKRGNIDGDIPQAGGRTCMFKVSTGS